MRFLRLLALVLTLAACSSDAESPITLPLSTTVTTTTQASTTTTTTTPATTTVVPTTVFDPSKYVIHNVEDLAYTTSPGLYTTWQDMSQWDHGWAWGGLGQLFVGSQLGDWIEFTFPITAAGTYDLEMWLTRAPDFGIVRVTIDGTDIDDVDLYATDVQATQGLSMGRFDLAEGLHTVRFTVLGRSPQSTGTYFGIDTITVIGPE